MADVLKHNKVIYLLTYWISINVYFFFQTLNKLSLAWNQIGEDGTKYLSDALQNNRVRSLVLAQIYFQLFRRH